MPFPANSHPDDRLYQQHQRQVETISSSVRGFYDRKAPYRIYHGSTNSTRKANWAKDTIVDTSGLDRVLSVDKTSMTALVEPNVPMDALVDATLKHGLVPPVVMEFPGITAGGGFSGTSAESSSFRQGIFDQTVLWIEVVLPNGELVTASHDANSDLLRAAASAFGTLGVVTLLQFRLIPAARYVQLQYQPVSNMAQALKDMDAASQRDGTQYLDGIMYSKTDGIICIGKLTDDLPDNTKPQTTTKRSDPWFYLRAQAMVKQHPTGHTDYIPLRDYLFRYDRGGFWVAKYSFRYFLVPFNRATRWLLDPLMNVRVMYHALHKSGFADRYLLQDVAVPTPAAEQLMDYVDDAFGRYPIWLCPLRPARDAPIFHGSSAAADDAGAPDAAPPFARMFLNFGVWGPGPTERKAFVAANRALEARVRALGGLKCLYAHAYYTEDEFWAVFDRQAYDAARARYHADHLPSVYDKVKVDFEAQEREARATPSRRAKTALRKVWPVAGVYGVLHTLLRKDYLMAKGGKSSQPATATPATGEKAQS